MALEQYESPEIVNGDPIKELKQLEQELFPTAPSQEPKGGEMQFKLNIDSFWKRRSKDGYQQEFSKIQKQINSMQPGTDKDNAQKKYENLYEKYVEKRQTIQKTMPGSTYTEPTDTFYNGITTHPGGVRTEIIKANIPPLTKKKQEEKPTKPEPPVTDAWLDDALERVV